MAGILKPVKGESFVFAAKYVDAAEGKYGPQLKLKDAGSNILYVPAAAESALLAVNAMLKIGEGQYRGTSTAFQCYQPEKGPLRIGKVGEDLTLVPKATPVGSSAAPAKIHATPLTDLAHLSGLYAGCVAECRNAWGKEWTDMGGEGMAAAVATLFIAARHAGVTMVSPFDDLPEELEDEPPLPF